MSDQKTPFADLMVAKPDAILGLLQDFRDDPRGEKINLGVGVYRNDAGKAQILESVKRAEERLIGLDKEYLPIDGDPSFIQKTLELTFGKVDDKTIGIQVPGGTAALRIAGEFLLPFLNRRIWLSEPTWPNHPQIFGRAGYEILTYPYYKKGLLFDALIEKVKEMKRGDIILLQVCCHNPSGADLNGEHWRELSKLIKERGIFPLFDMAYQGFAKSVEEDRCPLKLFREDGHEFMVAVSYSKSFGLYGERVGLLAAHFDEAQKVLGNIKQIIRALYSNPPMHGGRIVSTILGDVGLKNLWLEELMGMRKRLSEMRHQLAKRLPTIDFIKEQNGMFSFLPLNSEQVELLQKNSAIFMPRSGRISFSGLNHGNIDPVANALGEYL